MNVIKFDLQDLEKDESGFTYYLQGRSYDLEENGVKKHLKLLKNVLTRDILQQYMT